MNGSIVHYVTGRLWRPLASYWSTRVAVAKYCGQDCRIDPFRSDPISKTCLADERAFLNESLSMEASIRNHAARFMAVIEAQTCRVPTTTIVRYSVPTLQHRYTRHMPCFQLIPAQSAHHHLTSFPCARKVIRDCLQMVFTHHLYKEKRII